MSLCNILVSLLIIQASESDKDNYNTPKLTADILATVQRIDSTWDETTARAPKVSKCIEGVEFRSEHYDDVWAHSVLENLNR